jgi:DNA polymerase-3 subunit delta
MPRNVADPQAVLLHGEETFLAEEDARRRLATWSGELVSDFGYEALDPGSLNAARLRDSLLQAPFLDPFRVVVVRALPPRKADSLAPALKEVPETTRLLITVSGRLGAGSPLVKAIGALPAGAVKEFPRLKGRGLGDWASDRGRELGLPGNVVALTVRASQADVGVIDSELRKLASYKENGGALDPPTVNALLAGGHEDEIFRLSDNLLPRPTAEAYRTARSLIRQGWAPTTMAYRLARHLALVLEVKSLRDRGESLNQIQAALSEHPFVVQKAFETAASVSEERLEVGLRAILTYEWEVKSGQVDAELGLDGVLAAL